MILVRTTEVDYAVIREYVRLVNGEPGFPIRNLALHGTALNRSPAAFPELRQQSREELAYSLVELKVLIFDTPADILIDDWIWRHIPNLRKDQVLNIEDEHSEVQARVEVDHSLPTILGTAMIDISSANRLAHVKREPYGDVLREKTAVSVPSRLLNLMPLTLDPTHRMAAARVWSNALGVGDILEWPPADRFENRESGDNE